MKKHTLGLSIATILLLAACGGGGSDDNSPADLSKMLFPIKHQPHQLIKFAAHMKASYTSFRLMENKARQRTSQIIFLLTLHLMTALTLTAREKVLLLLLDQETE